MPDSVQLPLPGFPLRIVVSAVWEDASRPCTVQATVDLPSDQFSSQIVGQDTSGRMTWEELESCMATMLASIMDRHAELTPQS